MCGEIMYNFFVFLVLLMMIVYRIYIDEVNTVGMNICVYIALIVSLIDLYRISSKAYEGVDKFHMVRGGFIICLIGFAVVLAGVILGAWVPSSKENEVVTLLALWFTLCQNTFVSIIGGFLNEKSNK